MIKKLFIVFLFLFSSLGFCDSSTIQVGAEQLNQYLPLLKEKRVGLFANSSSLVGKTHLLDVLLQHHIHVTKLFAPEHGFRGDVDKPIQDSIDVKTGIPIISLYGKKVNPRPRIYVISIF